MNNNETKGSQSVKRFLFIVGSLLTLVFWPTSSALDKEALRQAISGLDRDPNDLARDEARKPVEVLDFLGVDEGMSVLDVYAAGGYYTFILSKAVGPTGIVYAQNTEQGLSFQEGRQNISQGDAFAAKILGGNIENVTHILAPISQLQIPAQSLDMILLAQSLHDFYNADPERARTILEQLGVMLKPDGVFGIIDHVGLEGQGNLHMHRMEKQQAIDVAELAGYKLIEESDLLKNDNDAHIRHVFHPTLNRNTDRFLFKFQKEE